MKILQILPELNVGGVETGTVDFAQYLVEHGHQSIVVSNGGALVDGLVHSGSKHYQLPVGKKSVHALVDCSIPADSNDQLIPIANELGSEAYGILGKSGKLEMRFGEFLANQRCQSRPFPVDSSAAGDRIDDEGYLEH